MELFRFQREASTQIAERFARYWHDPLPQTRTRNVPFYQNLASITGSGKTLILADAIQQIRTFLSVEPIVLWLSKGKVVVWQTYHNLAGGKYAGLLSGYAVKPLLDCSPHDLEEADQGLVLVATVGKFNQKHKEQGDRKIYQIELDKADHSLWDQLKRRRDREGRRRPFLIVYDEGHNLSDQQTDLLLELEPDALLAASATLRVPQALERIIERLRQDKGWRDEDFVTAVRSSQVVEAGLVKQQILLGGYITPMETAIDDLLDGMRRAEQLAQEHRLPFLPKAIYVSNTNVVNAGEAEDDPSRPFDERKARPILIWRHLVEHHGIDPQEIAVYCNLKFSKEQRKPDEMVLFDGGESDFEAFRAGAYRHIIFNLTLQEGWDDPACYFAYIDKAMGSKTQVTQIIGRVLRQPGAAHFPAPELNTAHFYIRTDERSVYDQVLGEVRSQVTADTPEIDLSVYRHGTRSDSLAELKPRWALTVPEVSIYSAEAVLPIRQIVDRIHDYRKDAHNTAGKGGRIRVLQTIGKEAEQREEWVEVEQSIKVPARWIFRRSIPSSQAVNLSDIEQPKFDALVEYNSRAAEVLREAADHVLKAYMRHSCIVQNHILQIPVPSVYVSPGDASYFQNAVHEAYSGLNKLELKFARALDEDGKRWMRNPSKGYLKVPLMDFGATRHFHPDFVVWSDQAIFAIDTKGKHLILEDAGRKLFHIEMLGEGKPLYVRLVSEGEWNEEIKQIGPRGYTVWTLKNGKAHPVHCADVQEAVRVCVRAPLSPLTT